MLFLIHFYPPRPPQPARIAKEYPLRCRIFLNMEMPRQPIIEELACPPSPLHALYSLDWQHGGFLLESAQTDGRLGRWSFLGANPFLLVTGKGGRVTIKQNMTISESVESPFALIKRLLADFALFRHSNSPPFIGGAVGYFGYDLCQRLERLPSMALDDLAMNDCSLGLYDVIIAIDHLTKRAFISSCGWPEMDEPARLIRAQQRLEETKARLETSIHSSIPSNDESALFGGGIRLQSPPPQSPICNFTHRDYLRAVEKAKAYIAAGDIYQVNLSQRFSYPFTASPGDLYQRLRQVNPAPFAGLLLNDDSALVSASPERFLQVRGDWVETRPIKGTRPRGITPQDDERLAVELLTSEKDRAENVMIVDLERNDLGKVCEYGTVRTTELWALEKYPTVFHLVSTVEGRLRQGKHAVDCLRACFPGGSITGAPKVRAMEIIEELEPTKRGPYTGALGYLCFSGEMDMNIIIRTFAIKDGMAHYQVGGGIVADSDPEAEYQETLDKGKALQWAILKESIKDEGQP